MNKNRAKNDFTNHWANHQIKKSPLPKLEAAYHFLPPIIEYILQNDKQPSFKILDAGCGDGIRIESLLEESIK